MSAIRVSDRVVALGVAALAACGGSTSAPSSQTGEDLEIRLSIIGTGRAPAGVRVDFRRQSYTLTEDAPLRLDHVPPGTHTTTVADLPFGCYPVDGDARAPGPDAWVFPEVVEGRDAAFEIELLCFGEFVYRRFNHTDGDFTWVSGSGLQSSYELPGRLPRMLGWSADGEAFLTASEVDGLWALFTFDPDAGTLSRLTPADADYRWAGWSPTGSRLVVARTMSDGSGDSLWEMGLDGTATRLTPSNLINAREPAWSPSGDEIAYSTWVGVGFDIRVAPVAGGAARSVASTPEHETMPQWSPSGEYILYYRDFSGPEPAEPRLVRSDGTGDRRLSPDLIGPCAWAPDSDTIVCGARDDAVRPYHLVDLDGTVIARLPLSDPTWTAGDRWIYGPDAGSTEGHLGFGAYRLRDGLTAFVDVRTNITYAAVRPTIPAR